MMPQAGRGDGMTPKTTGCALAATLMLLLAAAPAQAQETSTYDLDGNGRLDVLIVYDATGPYAGLGVIYSEMLMNLLGHFGIVDAWAISTAEYQAGDLLDNEVTFYIGSTYEEPLPAAFVADFWVDDRPLIWMGYNLWQIAWANWNDFILEYGFQHSHIEGNDGAGQNTMFYRYVQYQGTELPKFAWWNTDRQTFINDPFLNVLLIDDANLVDVSAEIVHSGSGDVQPYVLTSGNLTVVNDIPFTYIHEQDRYLAFADMLHDMIGIEHTASKKALFRLEDVHPNVAPSDIHSVTDVMREQGGRPWSIALVPVYADPLGYYNNGVPRTFDMNSRTARTWRNKVNRARNNGAELVMHGTTHQYGAQANPYNGVSGDDFEFWDAVAEAPVALDSYAWFADTVQDGLAEMAQRNWTPVAFEVPHYRASVADYLYLNDFFDVTYQRAVYQDYEVELWGNVYTQNAIWEDDQSVQDWNAANITVAGDLWGGQFYPYVIEKDVFGHKVLPENLGNIEPAEFALAPQYVRTVPDLLTNAEKNLVNRCGFASFFFHPYLIQFPNIPNAGGQQALRDIVNGIEAMGYTFVAPSSL
jgi:uncharacterized protein YdaL